MTDAAWRVLGAAPDFKRSGLNNQKLALLGLCDLALEAGGGVSFPERLVDLNPVRRSQSSEVDPWAVFNRQTVERFCEDHGLAVHPRADETLSWVECFDRGIVVARRRDAPFYLGFLAAFRATVALGELADLMRRRIGPEVPTLQMRVESDWQRHISGKIAMGTTHVFLRTPEEILSRVVNTPQVADARRIYMCCDARGIEGGVESIRKIARDAFGLEAIFREDVLTPAETPRSAMQCAALDFELCMRSRCYIGLERSSFSRLVYTTPHMAHDAPSAAHYRFDVPGDALRLVGQR